MFLGVFGVIAAYVFLEMFGGGLIPRGLSKPHRTTVLIYNVVIRCVITQNGQPKAMNGFMLTTI